MARAGVLPWPGYPGTRGAGSLPKGGERWAWWCVNWGLSVLPAWSGKLKLKINHRYRKKPIHEETGCERKEGNRIRQRSPCSVVLVGPGRVPGGRELGRGGGGCRTLARLCAHAHRRADRRAMLRRRARSRVLGRGPSAEASIPRGVNRRLPQVSPLSAGLRRKSCTRVRLHARECVQGPYPGPGSGPHRRGD